MKRTNKVLNSTYGLVAVLFLLDSLTGFDIKSEAIKSGVYFGLLIGTPLMLVWNFLVIKTKTKRMIGIIIPAIFLMVILIVGPMKFLFSTSTWHTQTILYQHGHLSFRTIEFQMQDVGASGYNTRTVEVFYLTPFFMIAGEVPNDLDKRVEWIRVDKDVNELGFKGG